MIEQLIDIAEFQLENIHNLHKQEICELALPFIDQVVTDHRPVDVMMEGMTEEFKLFIARDGSSFPI